MLRILQANLNRSKTANDLLYQLAQEKRADVLILSEQYRNKESPKWFPGTLGTAAIWITEPNKIPVESNRSRSGFVWIKSGGLTYFSCYLT